ncbi:hypothetical protein [Larkinella soli]|uniref:hypothetical protein n=1 Tax=Larkinella soli TaxID=1770527 RepID=UPI000FFB8707|nr:hypothetical protein [Larkinella soli]
MENTETGVRSRPDIKGWGIDADPANDPTYPMKARTDEEQLGYTWERPTQQPITVEVLHSNERPNVSAVYGSTLPPKGLSGQLRRYAFKYSESDYKHWLPLVLADRVDVVEGLIDDIKHGHIPNIFAERGWKVKWKHDRSGLIKDIAVAAVITYAVYAWLSPGRKKRRRD